MSEPLRQAGTKMNFKLAGGGGVGMDSPYRFLQTVMRERQEQDRVRRYRYDLLARCPREDHFYVIRARKTDDSDRQLSDTPLATEAVTASGISGDEGEILEVFLDIAHARDPVDPVHLPDILSDCIDESDLTDDQLVESHELGDYFYYDEITR